jgi:putative membrane protein
MAWLTDAVGTVGLLSIVLVAVYVTAWRLSQRGNRRRSVGPWPAAGFTSGLITLAVGLAPPLDRLAAVSLAAHMIQHLLIVVVAAPLLAAGRPLVVLAAAGGPARAVVRWVAPLVRRLLERPLLVWILHAGVLWIWHAPRLYQAALGSDVVHVLEHLTLLLAAVLFWSVVVEPGAQARLGPGAMVSYLFSTAMQSGVLGALLATSDTVWYSNSASLEDQQLAGALMWVPASIVYLAAGLRILAVSLTTVEGRLR